MDTTKRKSITEFNIDHISYNANPYFGSNQMSLNSKFDIKHCLTE